MKTLKHITFALLVAVLFAACGDNPVDQGEEEEEHEHALSDINRLELVLNGAEVVVIEDNQFPGGVPDTLHVPAGGETALITLEAMTEDGDEIHLDELGDEYSLAFSFSEPEVAEVEQHEGERWSFHLHGHGEVGEETDLVLDFLHIDHADFTTPAIPIELVEGDGDDHGHDH